jgi:hypothetical protein
MRVASYYGLWHSPSEVYVLPSHVNILCEKFCSYQQLQTWRQREMLRYLNTYILWKHIDKTSLSKGVNEQLQIYNICKTCSKGEHLE